MTSRRPPLSHGSPDRSGHLQDKYRQLIGTDGYRKDSRIDKHKLCPEGSRVIWIDALINVPFDPLLDPPIDDDADGNNDIVYANTIGSWKGDAFAVGQHHGVLKAGSFTLVSPDNRAQGYLIQYGTGGTVIRAFPIWLADGSRGNQEYARIGFDKSNNIYIIQSIAGDVTLTNGTVINESNGNHVLLKFTPEGTLVWFLQMKGVQGFEYDLAVDSDGTSYITGYYSGFVRMGGLGSLQASSMLVDDFFLSRVSSDGAPVWIRTAFGTGSIRSADVSLDSKNRLVVAGTFSDVMSIDGKELVNTIAQSNGWVGRFDTDGNLLSLLGVQHIPTPAPVISNEGNGLTLKGVSSDGQGNSYVVGELVGIFRFGGTVLTFHHPVLCVAAIGDNGSWLWARQIEAFLPRSLNPYPRISTSKNKGSYISLFALGEVALSQSSGETMVNEPSGSVDLVISKIDFSGTFLWMSTFFGVIPNPSESAATDANDVVFVIGNHCVDDQQIDGFVARLKSQARSNLLIRS